MSTAAFEPLLPGSSLRGGLEHSRLNDCLSKLGIMRTEFGNEREWEGMIGSSPALRSVLAHVKRVAPTNSTVLILGETGTGKELISQAIHNLSARCRRPFIKLNCAAIPFDLLELFGHERDAFTGAIAQRPGRFEMAHTGTLFLDQ